MEKSLSARSWPIARTRR